MRGGEGEAGRPQWNRMLTIMVLISMGIHSFFLLRIEKPFESRPMDYIEFELEVLERKTGRELPTPPTATRPEHLPPPAPSATNRKVHIPRPSTVDMTSFMAQAPETLAERPMREETPETPPMKALRATSPPRSAIPMSSGTSAAPTPLAPVETPANRVTPTRFTVPETVGYRVQDPLAPIEPPANPISPKASPLHPIAATVPHGIQGIPVPANTGAAPRRSKPPIHSIPSSSSSDPASAETQTVNVKMPAGGALADMRDFRSEAPVVHVESSLAAHAPETPPFAPLSWRLEEKPPRMVPARGREGDYYQNVWLRIEGRKRYPRGAIQRRIEGKVGVRFVIQVDGTVTDVAIVKPSSHRILNDAATETIRNASPFPAPPKEMFHEPVTMEITLGYELTK